MPDTGLTAHDRTALRRACTGIFGDLDADHLDDLVAGFEAVDVLGGQTLLRQGDPGDSLYILLRGRLNVSIADPDTGVERVVGDASPGESIGEIGLLTGEPRSASLWATRDSRLARMRRATFDALAEKHPALLRGLARVVVDLLRKRTTTARTQHTVGTITVLPIVESPETRAFAAKLTDALSTFGPTLRVDAPTAEKTTGIADARAVRPGSDEDAKLGSWLADEEDRRAFLVFEADASLTPWTDRCLRQADLVLAVARAQDDPHPTEAELALAERENDASRARHVLVLLHPGDAPEPGTKAWLAPRGVDQHHHVRTGHPGDLERLARILSGNAIGLVLGGGGARGFAHVGVHRALAEHGIPIDWIGGTSIGAVFGAGIALGWDPDRVEEQGRNAFVDERPFNDLTVPIVSLLSGRRIDRLTRRMFETQIEDMLLPYFCVSSDLTSSSLRVHEEGELWRAIRSSVSLPGVLPPAVLSRHLAIDGAILNNLPVDVMRDRAVANVIAVELSAGEESEELDVVEMPSPLQILLSRLPFTRRVRVPGIVTVLMKATVMASAVHSKAMRSDADLLLSPPVGQFGLLETNAFDAIVQAGYAHARDALKAWHPQPADRYVAAGAHTAAGAEGHEGHE